MWRVTSGSAEIGQELFEAEGSVDELSGDNFSPDDTLLMTAAGDSVLIWAVAGELFQSAIAASTSVCLTPEFRRQNLGESDAEARKKYEACQGKEGRK